ncbi:MAG: DUF4391 domain-containing protein [Clostridium sp.]|nr:DUF4391 domain-containing protein [Clostridium sp.]
MDAVYEGFIRQIAKESLEGTLGGDIKDAVALDKRRQKLQREIAVLEKKVRGEKQFNRQVELNSQLKGCEENEKPHEFSFVKSGYIQ